MEIILVQQSMVYIKFHPNSFSKKSKRHQVTVSRTTLKSLSCGYRWIAEYLWRWSKHQHKKMYHQWFLHELCKESSRLNIQNHQIQHECPHTSQFYALQGPTLMRGLPWTCLNHTVIHEKCDWGGASMVNINCSTFL